MCALQVVTCSGIQADGSLRIVRNGIGMIEQATAELPGIKGVWALRNSTADQFDSRLVRGRPPAVRLYFGVGLHRGAAWTAYSDQEMLGFNVFSGPYSHGTLLPDSQYMLRGQGHGWHGSCCGVGLGIPPFSSVSELCPGQQVLTFVGRRACSEFYEIGGAWQSLMNVAARAWRQVLTLVRETRVQ